MVDQSDIDLLNELGVDTTTKPKAKRTPKDERIIAGFEEIQRFVEKHGHVPAHGEDKDIFERLYAVRLDQIRKQKECVELLEELDYQGLLNESFTDAEVVVDELNDDELLAELGVGEAASNDITQLKHVVPRAEKRAVEEMASRTRCEDFEKFKPLFESVQKELESGARDTNPFQGFADIREHDLFILSGQKVYVAEVGEYIKAPNGENDARMRVIYDNGTESDLLMRSLQRALYKDPAGRRITGSTIGPLFSGVMEGEDTETGTIYVLRSKSFHPIIEKSRDVIHKIGVTGSDVKRRIANAKLDPTFLMDDVDIVATYTLYNINRTKLEKLLHKFFDNARLDIEIKDRFGKPVVPREWFLVPLFVIDEVVEKIKEGTIGDYSYDTESASLVTI